MAKPKKQAEPLSLELSPLNKKAKAKEKLNIILKNERRKMVSWRLRIESINTIDEIAKKLQKKTKNKFSQSAVIEIALYLASKASVDQLLDAYGNTFKCF